MTHEVLTSESRPTATLTGRGLFYLDNNAWIDLSERYPDLADGCRQAVAREAALFPLSFSAFSELVDQDDRARQFAQASLMDELSCGVAFRASEQIEAMELNLLVGVAVGAAIGLAKPLPRSHVLTFLGESMGTLQFDADWTNEAQVAAFRTFMAEQPFMRSVRSLLKCTRLPEAQAIHRAKYKEYADSISKVMARSASDLAGVKGRARRDRLQLNEFYSILRTQLSPTVRRVLTAGAVKCPPGTVESFDIDGVVGLATQAFEELFRKRRNVLSALAPMIVLKCELLGSRNLDPRRKPKPQDFHDVEHAVQGAYSDYFVTGDGNLVTSLSQHCSVLNLRTCRIIRLCDLGKPSRR